MDLLKNKSRNNHICTHIISCLQILHHKLLGYKTEEFIAALCKGPYYLFWQDQKARKCRSVLGPKAKSIGTIFSQVINVEQL